MIAAKITHKTDDFITLSDEKSGTGFVENTACSRLRDSGEKSFSKKKCEKRAGTILSESP